MRLMLLVLLLLLAPPVQAQPGALDWLVGTWDTQETFHQEGGGTGQGVVIFSKTLDGKFLYEEYRSTWPSGPYEGRGYMLWNPAGGQLDLWWFDNAGTGSHGQTTWDGAGPRVFIRVVDMNVERETYTRTGPDEYRYTMEKDSGQGYQPVMELVARRRR